MFISVRELEGVLNWDAEQLTLTMRIVENVASILFLCEYMVFSLVRPI